MTQNKSYNWNKFVKQTKLTNIVRTHVSIIYLYCLNLWRIATHEKKTENVLNIGQTCKKLMKTMLRNIYICFYK